MMRQSAQSIVTGRDANGHLLVNWSNLDAAAAAAAKHGKLWAVAVNWSTSTPAFLGIKTYPFAQGNAPVPWDPALIAVEKEFIAAFGARFGADPNLTVFMGGLGSNSGIETYVAKTPEDIALIGDAGASAKWIAGDQQIIDAYAAALPRAALGMAAGVPFPGDDKSLTALVDWAAAKYPHFGVYCFSLKVGSNVGYPPNALVAKYAATHPCGFQFVWNTSDPERLGGTLKEVCATGQSLLGGNGQIQIYGADGDNPALQTDIAAVNAALKLK